MTRKEKHLTNILRSRGVGFIITLISIWMAWHALRTGSVAPFPSGNTFAFSSLSTLFADSPLLSFTLAIITLVGTAGVMVWINSQFNLLRTVSVFFVAFFIFTACCVPTVTAQFGAPLLLAFTVMLCVWIMFSIYAAGRSSRRVFLVFALLSTGGLFDYGFLLYVPVFIAGLGQMRLFRLKKLVAMALGVITPPWIAYGMGFVDTFTVPRLYHTPLSDILSVAGGIPFLVTVGVLIATEAIFGVINLFRILGFNARARAFNGLLSLVAVSTAVYAVINFTHLWLYVPLICATVALQTGLFFRYYANRRAYLVMLMLLGGFAGLYLWQINTLSVG